jgi:type 1 glutamine amidotransferase
MSIKTVLLGGNRFSYHRLEKFGPYIGRMFDETEISIRRTTDRDVLTDGTLADVDVLLSAMTDNTLTDGQQDALVDFVKAGGGFAGVHGASCLQNREDENDDEPIPKLRDMLGGHFLGHPAQTNYRVTVTNSFHPITSDLESFHVWDEPYRVATDDDVNVLVRMDHPEFPDMPMVWVKSLGEGRVFYCSLGHDEHSLTNPSVAELYRRGVRWVG